MAKSYRTEGVKIFAGAGWFVVLMGLGAAFLMISLSC